MLNLIRKFAGWATPIAPGFDAATLARNLSMFARQDCNSRKFGRCPGKEYCADCSWSEGSERPN